MEDRTYRAEQVGENTFFIPAETNVGIYRTGPETAAVIDTGRKHMGPVIEEILGRLGLRPEFIVNTHSHKDHMNANAYLMERFGIPAYTTGYEILFDRFPDLEPGFFYGGYPASRFREMFGHEKDSGLTAIETADLRGLEYVRLPGHSPDMIAIKTPDDVWFTGDAYLGLGYLREHTFGYFYNMDDYLQSLKKAAGLKGSLFIQSHGRTQTDLTETIEANFANIRNQIALVLAACESYRGFDEVLKVMRGYYRLPEDVGYYTMTCACLRSLISYLQDSGSLEYAYVDGIMKWRAV